MPLTGIVWVAYYPKGIDIFIYSTITHLVTGSDRNGYGTSIIFLFQFIKQESHIYCA